MEGSTWKSTEEMRLTSIWAIHDPDGLYQIGMADLTRASDAYPPKQGPDSIGSQKSSPKSS